MTTARDADELRRRLSLPEFPRSARYDPRWMVDNAMGPNPLWLLENLIVDMRLEPGMRVLDLGCGKAMTSVFLAREFGVRVCAADLWIPPGENWRRIRETDCADLVVPLHAEAHDLPFAAGYFDAVVSVDAFHYFGTDDLYLGYLAEFVAPGGQIGIAVPTVSTEIDRLDAVPERLRTYWQWEFMTFHTVAWWRDRWMLSGRVTDVHAAPVENGWRHWRDWCRICADHATDEHKRAASAWEAEMLTADAGQTLGFATITGRVPPRPEAGAASPTG